MYNNYKMNFEEYITDISTRIFKQLGSGHIEGIYQEALIRELHKKFHAVEREKTVPILYIDTDDIQQSIGSLRIDIYVHDTNNNRVYLLEIKAVKNIGEIEVCQVNRYCDMLMKNYSKVVDEAYIINFTQPNTKSVPEDIMINRVV
jgi:GxxExxY protein